MRNGFYTMRYEIVCKQFALCEIAMTDAIEWYKCWEMKIYNEIFSTEFNKMGEIQ